MRRLTCVMSSLAIFGIVLTATADDASSAPRHLREAEVLVQQIKLDDTGYVHGEPRVEWKGPGSDKSLCFADCSGFIDALLVRSYGYSREDLRKWFGKSRPTANLYHDAIVALNGFIRVARFQDVRAGDLLAVKYLVRKDNTGHIMVAVSSPRRITAKKPLIDGTEQWELPIIDCSQSGHGTTDTRHKKGEEGKDHSGLGSGIVRVYTHRGGEHDGEIAGWTWSTLNSSTFLSPESEPLAVGRLRKDFRPQSK
jgi:hypothetical protein